MTPETVAVILEVLAAHLPNLDRPVDETGERHWETHFATVPDDRLEEILEAAVALAADWTETRFPGPAHLTELVRTRRAEQLRQQAVADARDAIRRSRIPSVRRTAS